MKDNLLGT